LYTYLDLVFVYLYAVESILCSTTLSYLSKSTHTSSKFTGVDS